MLEPTREQEDLIDRLAWAWGAVAVEPPKPDGTVRVFGAMPDSPTPLGLVLNPEGEIVGGGAA